MLLIKLLLLQLLLLSSFAFMVICSLRFVPMWQLPWNDLIVLMIGVGLILNVIVSFDAIVVEIAIEIFAVSLSG